MQTNWRFVIVKQKNILLLPELAGMFEFLEIQAPASLLCENMLVLAFRPIQSSD